jgi:hypothetical protein
VGVLVGSLEFYGSTWLFQSIGVGESKYAYPTRKGEGKKMTKRNLLVSLFLVLGLVVMTTSAMATEWSVGANVNSSGRSEGLAEAVGQVTVSEVAGGIVNSGS